MRLLSSSGVCRRATTHRPDTPIKSKVLLSGNHHAAVTSGVADVMHRVGSAGGRSSTPQGAWSGKLASPLAWHLGQGIRSKSGYLSGYECRKVVIKPN
jgi:hypothetical protein